MITPQQAAANILAAFDENRVRQNTWGDGHGLVCLLSAMDPSIEDTSTCPASLVPKWAAELLVRLFDGAPQDIAFDLGRGFARRLAGPPIDWPRAELAMRIQVVRRAIEWGHPTGPVLAACAGVIDALNGGGDLKAAATAAWVAAKAEAAWAAWVAWAAAAAAVAWAEAAEAAVWAAGAEAAEEARARAFGTLFADFLDMLLPVAAP